MFDIPELIHIVFSFLDFQSLYNTARVNRLFYQIFRITFTNHPVCRWRRTHHIFLKNQAKSPDDCETRRNPTFTVSNMGIEMFMVHRTLYLHDHYGFELTKTTDVFDKFRNNDEFLWVRFHQISDDSSLHNVFVSHTCNTTPTFYVIVDLRDQPSVKWETDCEFVAPSVQRIHTTHSYRSCLTCRRLSLYSYTLPQMCQSELTFDSKFHLNQLMIWNKFTILIFFCYSTATIKIFVMTGSSVVSQRTEQLFHFHHVSSNFTQNDFVFLSTWFSFSLTPQGRIIPFINPELKTFFKGSFKFISLSDSFYAFNSNRECYFCKCTIDGCESYKMKISQFYHDLLDKSTFIQSFDKEIYAFDKHQKTITKVDFFLESSHPCGYIN